MTTLDAERKHFERWYEQRSRDAGGFTSSVFDKTPTKRYVSQVIELMWLGWCGKAFDDMPRAK